MTRREIERIANVIKSLPDSGVTKAELIDIIGEAGLVGKFPVSWTWAKWAWACGYKFHEK